MRFTVEAAEFIIAFLCLVAVGYFYPVGALSLRENVAPTPHRFQLKVTYDATKNKTSVRSDRGHVQQREPGIHQLHVDDSGPGRTSGERRSGSGAGARHNVPVQPANRGCKRPQVPEKVK